jgi:hypothetical protein
VNADDVTFDGKRMSALDVHRRPTHDATHMSADEPDASPTSMRRDPALPTSMGRDPASPTSKGRDSGVDAKDAPNASVVEEAAATQTPHASTRALSANTTSTPVSSKELADLFGFSADVLQEAVYKAPDEGMGPTTGKRSFAHGSAVAADGKKFKGASKSLAGVFESQATTQGPGSDVPMQASVDVQSAATSVMGSCHNCGQSGHWARDCKVVLAKMTAGRDSKCALCVHSCVKGQDTIAKLGVGPFMYSWVHLACATEHLKTLGVL